MIRKKAGALGCINFEGNSFVSGLIFDGVDKSCNGTSQAAKVSGMWFFMVSMVRFDRGFGTGNTLNNSRLFFCHANQNDKGIGNLVDSHVTNCEINANRIGIDIQVGSNDTIYTGNKIEWNDEEGVRIYGRSASNIILGGVIDRNGEAGISVASSASLQVGDLKLRRNGRLSAGSRKCSHIYLEGNAEQSLTISNIKTDYAAGDSGEGDVTPQYTLASGGGAPTGSLLVTGSDLSGAAIGVFGFDHEPTNMKIVGCLGSDDWVTTGFPKIENGKMFFSKFSTGNISPGGTSAAITCELPPTGTQKRRTYGLQIDADNQSTGGTIAGLARFQVERDAGGARIDFAAVQWERSESSIGNTSGHTLQITISNVATDGSSFDVVIDNNHAGHTFSVDGFWI